MKSENSTAQIKCASDSAMHFYQSQSIHIANLEFIGCGGNQVRHVEEFIVEDTKFEGQENSGTALELIETTVQIINSTFLSNKQGYFDPDYNCRFDGFIGGAIIAANSTVDISQSRFEDNGADCGGATFAEQDSIINMSDNVFVGNGARLSGGVLYSHNSTIIIEASEFNDNSAIDAGGVLFSYSSTIRIKASKFHGNCAANGGRVLYSSRSTNSAALGGGVLFSTSSTITIEASEFHDNNAKGSGGVLLSDSSIITIEASGFYTNNATVRGGVLDATSCIITIAGSSNFTNNVSPIGAIFYATSRSTIQQKYSFLLIDNNVADKYAVIYLSGSEIIGHHCGNVVIFSSNLGSLVAFNGKIAFTGNATFVNNTPSQTTSGDFQEGGAITLFQSKVFFDGVYNLEHNHAENGGAIHSTESKLYVKGDVTIAHNTATGNGGGVYLSTSELNCQQNSTFILWNNTASHKGGGLHAISSSIKAGLSNSQRYYNNSKFTIYTGARINITGNAAEKGGGVSLEANTKVFILKRAFTYYYNHFDTNATIFIANSADYGGAIHVDDNTNSGTCAGSTETECFFQVLALYSVDSEDLRTRIRTQSMHFSQNHANISGSTLYGGLLDRCAVSPFAEVHNKYPRDFKDRGGGIAYFKNVSTYTYYNPYYYDYYYYYDHTREIISSDPVRVCLCFNTNQNND